jgi:PPM family protein phosphatase
MSSPEDRAITCPRCGHENVSSALYCFRCGRDLREASSIEGSPGAGKMIAGALRFIQMRGYMAGLDTLDRLAETKRKMPSDNVIGQPLICLQCGMPNRPDARRCEHCGTLLVVPDTDFNLIPYLSGRSDVGMVRSNNEDSLCMWGINGVIFVIVADGMGGAAAGEIASGIAVESVQAHFLGPERGAESLHALSESTLKDNLRQSIIEGNYAVLDRASHETQLHGMGTTATLALMYANRLIVAHVGDSRAYHIEARTGKITQVTQDHSFVQALISSGHITPDQALTHPMGHVLYRALGQSPDLEVDVYARYVANQDWIILCSDGLTLHVSPAEIAEIVLSDANPHVATESLIALAKQRGAMDNVSVIAAHIIDTTDDETTPVNKS